MRNVIAIIVIILVPIFCLCQDISAPVKGNDYLVKFDKNLKDSISKSKGFPMEGFAVSFNPLGFLFCGPTFNADIRLANRLMFRVHLRFSSYSMISATSGPNEFYPDIIGSIALGGGPIYFFGKNLNKPYLGLILDGERSKGTFYNLHHNKCEAIIKTTTYSINGGYRIRFNKGLFINGGVYIGACYKKWDWYCYKDTLPGKKESQADDHITSQTSVFFMGEVAIGFAF